MADIELVGLTNPPGVSWQSDIHVQVSTVELVRLANQGGIGFRFEAGVIVVTAYADRVNVQADRPFSSLGSHVHAPPGNSFDIGTPSLTATSTLDIPIVVASYFDLLSAIPTSGLLTLTFSGPAQATAQGLDSTTYYVTTTTPGASIPTVTRVAVVNDTVQLFLTGQTIGANYTIHMLPGVYASSTTGVVWPGTSVAFTGTDDAPIVSVAYAETNNSIVLIFSEEVNETSATNLANYSISPAISILSVVRLDATTYRMTTGAQTPGQIYNITLTGIIDRANNPI